MINSSMTVREVAVELPQSTRVFEKLKIDYCCGGNRPLAEACASIGVEPGEVLGMLEAVRQAGAQGDGATDFQKLPLSGLIAYILDTHHVFTKQEMTRLELLTKKVISAHGENHPELHKVGALFDTLCADLKPHMFKEEQILFPYILALASANAENSAAPFAPSGTVNNPIRMMMREHDIAWVRSCGTSHPDVGIHARLQTDVSAIARYTKRWKHLKRISISTFIWRTTFSSHARSSWKLR
jgi:regulator of cell morphogenesis and NO signaling